MLSLRNDGKGRSHLVIGLRHCKLQALTHAKMHEASVDSPLLLARDILDEIPTSKS